MSSVRARPVRSWPLRLAQRSEDFGPKGPEMLARELKHLLSRTVKFGAGQREDLTAHLTSASALAQAGADAR